MSQGQSSLGLKPHQLKIVYDFGQEVLKNPRVSAREFHRKYHPYSRKESTNDLINKAFEKLIVYGPFLFCNNNIDVSLLRTGRIPFELYDEKRADPKTTRTTMSCGDWNLLWFHRGASTLQYADVIFPTYPSKKRLEDIIFSKKGKFQDDPYPMGWDEFDWQIFSEMRNIRAKTFVEVGQKYGVTWKTVKNRFEKIFEQCKVFTSFYPFGYFRYHDLLLTFNTDYEVGLKSSLKKIDRSSFIWKTEGMVLLMLHLAPLESYNNVANRFAELEELGLIQNLKVSIPIRTESSID